MDSPKLNKLYLVLEYMKKGDLMKILNGDARRVECDPMSVKDVWHVFRQVTFNDAALILCTAVVVISTILSLSHTHTHTLHSTTQGSTGSLISSSSEHYPW